MDPEDREFATLRSVNSQDHADRSYSRISASSPSVMTSIVGKISNPSEVSKLAFAAFAELQNRRAAEPQSGKPVHVDFAQERSVACAPSRASA